MSDTTIPVRYDLPIPEGRAASGNEKLRLTLRLMKVGGSFEWPNYQHPSAMAKSIGVRIKGQKHNEGGYTIWKVSKVKQYEKSSPTQTQTAARCQAATTEASDLRRCAA